MIKSPLIIELLPLQKSPAEQFLAHDDSPIALREWLDYLRSQKADDTRVVIFEKERQGEV